MPQTKRTSGPQAYQSTLAVPAFRSVPTSSRSSVPEKARVHWLPTYWSVTAAVSGREAANVLEGV